MKKARNKADEENTPDTMEKKYFPAIRDVRVLKSKHSKAIYLEISGMNKSYDSNREWEFCVCYMAESPAKMKKLLEKHIGAGAGITEPQYPVKRAGENFDCMIGNTRTTWACLQGYLIKQMERDDPHEKMERVFQEKELERIFKVLRRDILDFTDMDNRHRPGSSYQHNIFMKRIKGFVTQVFPYLPERLQKDEKALFCLIKSTLTGEKLWEDLYSD